MSPQNSWASEDGAQPLQRTPTKSMGRYGHVYTALKRVIPGRYDRQLRQLLRVDRVHWCRVVMNQEVDKFITSLDTSRLDVLEISGANFRDKFQFKSYRTAAYPDYDVCGGPLLPASFDLIIAEQVFEHVLHPDRAAASVYQMLRPGGVFIIDTPFLLKVHPAPVDLYRWTEHGIRTLLEGAGFRQIETGSWGNRRCLIRDLTPGLEWAWYNPLLHTLKNEPQFAISVWAFAQKSDATS
jgi:SAM-dependent methyltransferase